MKIGTLLLGSTLAACLVQSAEAARPDTRRMTCATAQAVVRQYGSVVMTTGQYTYARIVAGRGYCGPREETQIKIAPTLDNPHCRVGFICRPSIFFD